MPAPVPVLDSYIIWQLFALDCYSGYRNSWTFANAEVIGNWSLDFALEYQVYTSYVGE